MLRVVREPPSGADSLSDTESLVVSALRDEGRGRVSRPGAAKTTWPLVRRVGTEGAWARPTVYRRHGPRGRSGWICGTPSSTSSAWVATTVITTAKNATTTAIHFPPATSTAQTPPVSRPETDVATSGPCAPTLPRNSRSPPTLGGSDVGWERGLRRRRRPAIPPTARWGPQLQDQEPRV